MKKVSIANIIISIIIVIIAGVLFYNNRYNISNDMDNTEMYVMLRNMEVNANTQWQEFPDNKKLQNDSLSLFIRNLKTPTLMLRIKETSCQLHIPADTRSAFPVISVQSPVSIQCCWQS